MPSNRETPQDDDFRKVFQNVAVARKAITDAANGARNVVGQIDCPIDGGRLNYKIASNGHVWGACSNNSCVRWME